MRSKIHGALNASQSGVVKRVA